MESTPWRYDGERKEWYIWDFSLNRYVYQSEYPQQPQHETTPRQATGEQSVPLVHTAHPREFGGGSCQYECVSEALAGFRLQEHSRISEKQDSVSQDSVDDDEVEEQPQSAQTRHQTLPSQENANQAHAYGSYPNVSYPYPQSGNQPAAQGSGVGELGTHPTAGQPDYANHSPNTSSYYQPSFEIVEAGRIPGKKDNGRSVQSTRLVNPRNGLVTSKRPSESTEELDPSFKVRRPGYDFFKVGKVFRVVWPELAGDAETVTATIQWRKERIYVKVRWFVVIREGSDCCSCLPIQTHGGKGASNKIKNHHAIIYTGNEEPKPLDAEISDRKDQLLKSIRVTAHQRSDKLDPRSRINFQKVYNVEHNVKVYDFGRVHEDSEFWLNHHFKTAWSIEIQGSAMPSSAKTRSHARSRRSSLSTNDRMSSNASVTAYQKQQSGNLLRVPASPQYGRTLNTYETNSRSRSRARQPETLPSVHRDATQLRGQAAVLNPQDPYGYPSTATAPNSYPPHHTTQSKSKEGEDNEEKGEEDDDDNDDEDDDEDEDEEKEGEDEEEEEEEEGEAVEDLKVNKSHRHAEHNRRTTEGVITQGRERTGPRFRRPQPEVKKGEERRRTRGSLHGSRK